ncbi:MAG: hypothetical protein WC796_01510 [Candidatus Pacearchaeota archaeon]|jgi:hypothetical protein
MLDNQEVIKKCRVLLHAYKSGGLGQTVMPEDSNPGFNENENENELRLAYFTLPMALNYQRNSYKLWEAALKTYNDNETKIVFDVSKVVQLDEDKLREYLTRYKLALQPNKQTNTWSAIAQTVYEKFGSFENLMEQCDSDYLKLRKLIQIDLKKGFPYLSGPKIFNYWSFIIKEYGKVSLKNAEYIEIAPDTHITQCSVLLGVVSQDEADKLSKDKISEKWREILRGSGINPIDMHPPLWFWSRNGFIFKI